MRETPAITHVAIYVSSAKCTLELKIFAQETSHAEYLFILTKHVMRERRPPGPGNLAASTATTRHLYELMTRQGLHI